MKLLVVEDEAAMRKTLANAFEDQHFAVDTAEDGEQGLFMAREYNYDLAVIDLGLPKISGLELISTIRALNKKFPIMVLTARSNWQEKVEALKAGADDYVVKPFHIEEVLARINALVRRSGGHASPKHCYGPLMIDTAAKKASIDGRLMELTSYEYNTLEYLVHHAGRIVSKTELTEHLYDQDFDLDSNVIEVFIGRLRKKIDPTNTLKPIATLRRQGYRFDLKANEN